MKKCFNNVQMFKSSDVCNKYSKSVSYETLVGGTATTGTNIKQTQKMFLGNAVKPLSAVGTLTSLLCNSAKVMEKWLQMSPVLRLVKVLGLVAVLSVGIISESWAINCYGVEFPNCNRCYDVANGAYGFECSSCPRGFFLNRGFCQMCFDGYYCEGGTKERKKCPTDKYIKQDGAKSSEDCVSCPEGSHTNYSGGPCEKPAVDGTCESGWYLISGKCRPCLPGYTCTDGIQTRCPAGTYGVDGSCTPCPAGTYQGYKAKSFCNRCDSNRVSAEGSQNCSTTCPAGTKKEGSACLPVPGCLTLENDNCTECADGYLTNSGGTCTPTADCKDGFHVEGDTCAANSDANCNTEVDGQCTECKTDYLINSDGGCTAPENCNNGWHIDGDICMANSDANCNTEVDGQCTECKADYLTNPDGGCTATEACTGEYIVDSVNNACKKIPGCINFADGACGGCESGYYKKDGGCVSAAEGCGSGYLEKDSVCISSANGCGAGYKNMGGFCNRIRYTPAEAAAVLHDDNTNEVTITFKK